jgi:uncharacterized membrane protein
MPPWANPDEPNHMLRIVELAHGELIGQRSSPKDAGGLIDEGVFDAATPFEPLKFHPDRKVTHSLLRQGDRVPWRDSLSFAGFANTAPYSPFLYLPAITAVQVGQMVGLRVDRTLYLARTAMALTAALATATALTLARRTRYVLATLAMLPMSCELYASASQDALIIGVLLLAVGWIDYIIDRGHPANWVELSGLALALAAVAMARPPYVPLASLLLLGGERWSWSTSMAACFVLIMVGIWSAFAAATVLVAHGEPPAQITIMLADPLWLGKVLVNTIEHQWRAYVVQFIGDLGWLDTPVPKWYVTFALAVLGAAFAAASNGLTRYPWLALAAVMVSALLIFTVQYVSWTQPGAAINDAISGRYLIPLAAALVLAVPGFPRVGRAAGTVALGGVVVLAIATPFVTIHALVVRYYLSG